MTLGKVKRITLGQLAHLSGPGGSDSGLGCLFELGVKVGYSHPLPGLDCFTGKWKAWLPGTCRKTGMGFLLPSPKVSHNYEFRRAFESASKTSNRLSGFDSLPSSEAGQGLSPSVSLPVPSSWGSEQCSGFPQGHRASSGAEPADTPLPSSLPQCSLGHISSAGMSARLCPVS